MDTLLSLVILIFMGYLFWKFFKPQEHEEEIHGELNFIRSEQELDKINKQKDELRALEYLITDINACSDVDGLYKYFTLSWLNENTGEALEYQFFIYDKKSAVAKSMVELADVERARLRPEYQKSLDLIGKRSRSPINKMPEIIIRDHRDAK